MKALMPQDRTDKEAPSQGPVLSAVAFQGFAATLTRAPTEALSAG